MITKTRKIAPRVNPYRDLSPSHPALPTLVLRCEELPKMKEEWQADGVYDLQLTVRVSKIDCPSNGDIKDVTFEIQKVTVEEDNDEETEK